MENKVKIRSNEDKKILINRLRRIEGQIRGIQKMIEDNRYCHEVIIQLSAVDKSIKSLANSMLDNHMHTCLINHIQNGNLEAVDEVVDLFKRFQ